VEGDRYPVTHLAGFPITTIPTEGGGGGSWCTDHRYEILGTEAKKVSGNEYRIFAPLTVSRNEQTPYKRKRGEKMKARKKMQRISHAGSLHPVRPRKRGHRKTDAIKKASKPDPPLDKSGITGISSQEKVSKCLKGGKDGKVQTKKCLISGNRGSGGGVRGEKLSLARGT